MKFIKNIQRISHPIFALNNDILWKGCAYLAWNKLSVLDDIFGKDTHNSLCIISLSSVFGHDIGKWWKCCFKR